MNSKTFVILALSATYAPKCAGEALRKASLSLESPKLRAFTATAAGKLAAVATKLHAAPRSAHRRLDSQQAVDDNCPLFRANNYESDTYETLNEVCTDPCYSSFITFAQENDVDTTEFEQQCPLVEGCPTMFEISLAPAPEGTPDGETACEGQGFNEEDCDSVGCCHWNDGQCWSDVGQDACLVRSFEENIALLGDGCLNCACITALADAEVEMGLNEEVCNMVKTGTECPTELKTLAENSQFECTSTCTESPTTCSEAADLFSSGCGSTCSACEEAVLMAQAMSEKDCPVDARFLAGDPCAPPPAAEATDDDDKDAGMSTLPVRALFVAGFGIVIGLGM